MFAILRQHKELLLELTKRELKQRYKQSVLGYAWVILNPFFQMLVLAFVFSKIIRMPELSIPYSIFLYAGLLPWLFFSNSLSSSVNVLVGHASLIKKIYFPRELLVISTILAKVVDLLLASSIFVIFIIITQTPVSRYVWWIFPIFLVQSLFTYSISLIAATLNLFYRDIQYVLGLVLLLWMYLTPVIYPIELIPMEYRYIFKLNPMAVIINAYRQVIFGGTNPNFVSLSIAVLLSVILFIVGHLVFKKLEGNFADVV